MAFESINWFAPVQAQQQQQAQFADMIGKGIQAGQRREELDLKRRQLESKANELDLDKLADTAAIKFRMGIPLNDKERAAAEVKAITSQPVVYTDAYGNQVVQPSGRREIANSMGLNLGGSPMVGGISEAGAFGGSPTIGGATMATPSEEAQINDMMGSPAPIPSPETRLSVNDLSAPMNEYIEPIPPQMLEGAPPVGSFPNDPRVGAVQGQDVVSTDTYQAPAKFGAKGEIMQEQSKQKLQDEIVKGAVKEKQEIEKRMREAKRPDFEPLEGITPSNDDVKAMTDIVISQKMLKPLIKDYTTAVKKYGVSVEGSRGAKVLDRISGKIRMQVKNLEQLGALQQPDIEAMNEMLGSAVFSMGDVANPISGFSQIKAGKDIAINSLNEFDTYIDNTVQSQARARGFKLKGQSPVSDKPKPTPEQIKAELDRRRGVGAR